MALKKRKGILLLFTLLFVAFFIAMGSFTESPEMTILGRWKEAKWEYEKTQEVITDEKFSAEIKELIGERLFIHKAEVWRFLPEQKLILIHADGSQDIGSWVLIGRGHILKIIYQGNTIEQYDIIELNNEQMVLNFDIGMEIKGIAKLTFRKTN